MGEFSSIFRTPFWKFQRTEAGRVMLVGLIGKGLWKYISSLILATKKDLSIKKGFLGI